MPARDHVSNFITHLPDSIWKIYLLRQDICYFMDQLQEGCVCVCVCYHIFLIKSPVC